jgi:putative ABC transport system permease protein
LALTRYVETLLFGLEPNDVLTFAGVVALIGSIALVAAAAPARRAAQLDPLHALRHE